MTAVGPISWGVQVWGAPVWGGVGMCLSPGSQQAPIALTLAVLCSLATRLSLPVGAGKETFRH